MLILQEDLEIHAVEKNLERAFVNWSGHGILDLLLWKKNNHGQRVVVDYKYSNASKLRNLLREGSALQLAFYGKLLEGIEETETVASLYYSIIDDTCLAFAECEFADGNDVEKIAGPSMAEVWSGAMKSFQDVREDLRRGVLRATHDKADKSKNRQNGELVDGHLFLKPPCKFCKYDVLCGKAFATEREI